MGISKKQLMDSVGLVKEYVDDRLDNNLKYSKRLAEEAVYGECVCVYSFNYTVGCDVSPLIKEHSFSGASIVDPTTGDSVETDIPMITDFQFVIVTIDVSTLCTKDDGTDFTVHSVESKMIPVSFLYDNELNLLVKSSSKACIHKIKVDIMKWDSVDNYFKTGTVTMSFILCDGSIEIVAYDVENSYANDDDVQHTMKLDVRYIVRDYVFMQSTVIEGVEDEAGAVEI